MQNLARKAIILACLLVVITAGVPTASADPMSAMVTDYVHCLLGHDDYCAHSVCDEIKCPF